MTVVVCENDMPVQQAPSLSVSKFDGEIVPGTPNDLQFSRLFVTVFGTNAVTCITPF